MPSLASIEKQLLSYKEPKAELPKVVHKFTHLFDKLTGVLTSPGYVQNNINPWKGSDQNVDFARTFGPIPLNGSRPLEAVPGRFLESQVPNRFQLAEILGLGTNSVRAIVYAIKPDLFTRPLYGYQIMGQVRHDILGEFHRHDSATAIQTFRWQIDSQSHFAFYEVDMGPGVKPHKFRLEGKDLGQSYGSAQGFIQCWKREKLAAQLSSRGIPLGIPLSETNSYSQSLIALEQAIEKELFHRRAQIIDAQLQALNAQEFFLDWRAACQELNQAEKQAHMGDAGCLLERFAQRLPTATEIEKVIRNQRNAATDLERLASQIDNSLALFTAHQFYHQLNRDQQTGWLQRMIQRLTAQ